MRAQLRPAIGHRPSAIGYPASWAICYHEAGHAVLSVVLRLGLRHALAVAGEGEVRYTARRRRRWQSACEREIIMTLAGHQAARTAVRHVTRVQARADDDEVKQLLRRCRRRRGTRRAYLTELELVTKDLVLAHWEAIDTVARRLRRRGLLDRAQVVRCVRA